MSTILAIVILRECRPCSRTLSYIGRKLSPNPHKLAGVCLQLLDAALVGFADVNGIASQVVDDIEVMAERIRLLVVFLGDVLSYRAGQ